MGAGLGYSLCRIDETAETFNEVSQFYIVGKKINPYLTRGAGYDRAGQGIWCIGNKLYKLFSYYIEDKSDDSRKIIKHNDLAVFQMPGAVPNISGEASLVRYYSCDRPAKTCFELESLASPDNGTTFYIAANVKEAGAAKQKDSIYSATLSDS